MVGAAIAAFAAGATRDLVGDDAIAVIVAGWMAVAAGIAALSIRRAGAQPAAPGSGGLIGPAVLVSRLETPAPHSESRQQ